MRVNCPHCLGIVDVIIETTEHQPRTNLQNKSLHKYCQDLADALNAAGLDMREVLRHHANIPWTMHSVKERIWKPVQEAMTGEESTAKVTTRDYPAIYDTLNAHFSEKHGLYVPWPCRETQMMEAIG